MRRFAPIRSSVCRRRVVAAFSALSLSAGTLAIGATVGRSAGDASASLATPAPAAATSSVTLDGHGIGHGIGLSQWGAYGYAVDHGWNSAQILDHYYGGTVAGTIPVDTVLPVRLLSLDDKVTTVVSRSGGLLVDGVAGGPWKSVTAQWTGTAYRVYARTTESCAVGGTQVAASVAGSVTIRTQADTSTTANYGDLLGVCQSDGSLRAYRGVIVATQAGTRTVNQVGIEHYLRSVVAKEVSPGWSTAGGGRGIQALQAQAVAARSYAFAENRYPPYAKTCDTTACQVYVGAATRASVASGFVQVEYPSTDAAVLATAGIVRRVGDANGAVAYTMFAASSGGYTLPGATSLTPFPAVVDEGDATAKNPYHKWSVTLTGAQLATAYPQIGSFRSITVVSRNGLGEWGGRVTSMRVEGSAGAVTLSGDSFKSKMGLQSSWFNVRGVAPVDACAGRNAPAIGAPPPAAAPARFTGITPVRLVDTRYGVGTPASKLMAGCTLVVDPGLADSVTAVSVNLTAVYPQYSGYLAAYPCGTERPVVSAVQAISGRVVAAATTVPLAVDGTFCVYSPVTTDVIVDLFGSYAVGSGDKFEPVSPTRLFDSRSGRAVAARSVVRVQVAGRAGTPAGATGAAFTLHVMSASSGGFATIYPCTAELPPVSSINVVDALGVTNHAQVSLSATGEVCVYVSTAMHVVVDLAGWYGSAATTEFVALPPARVIDSRVGLGFTGRLSAGSDRPITLAGVVGLPSKDTVRAVVAVVTAVDPAGDGWLTVHPCLPRPPDLSMVRYNAPWHSAATVIVPDDAAGRWCLTASKNLDVVMDVSGYFA